MKSVHSIAVLSALLLAACGGGSDGGQADSSAPRILSGGISTAAATACPAWTATAVYTAGIVKNHPFVDGNKRTGFVIGILFLEQIGRAHV